MAGEQDILSLGLNIESFDEKKKKILLEYIEIFDRLAKYDGKVFNPVFGDGLNKFNQSLKQSNALLDEMNAKLARINSLKISSVVGGGGANPIRQLTNDLTTAASATGKFSVQAGGARFNIENLGTHLTSMLTKLRYLAYILPGIGIAGIFNLAFEAIGKVVDEMGLLNNKAIEQTELSAKLAESWNKYAEAIDNVVNNMFKLLDLDVDSFQSQLKIEAQLKARGFEQGIVLNKELTDAKLHLDELTAKLAGSQAELGIVMKNTGRTAKEVAQHYVEDMVRTNNQLNNEIADLAVKRLKFEENIANKTKVDSSKAGIELINAQIADKKREFANREAQINDYLGAVQKVSETELKLQKFNSDQERALLVNRTKEDISLNEERNRRILDSDKKFYDEKSSALLKQFQDEKHLAEINRINVTGVLPADVTPTRPLNVNVGATPKEVVAAFNKQQDDIEKAKIKYQKAQEALDVEFYQRKLKALTAINISEVEQEAVKNEKIFQNETNSLQERLEAYNKYVDIKQKIADYEYARDIQRAASKKGGITSLTPEEKQEIEQQRVERQSNVVADAEAKVYQIVYSSLHKQIQALQDAFDTEEDISKAGYTAELESLNKRYEDKKISLTKYLKEKKKITERYEKEELDEEIRRDEDEVIRLQNLNFTKINLELQHRRAMLAIAKESGNEEEIEKAEGAVKAAERAVNEVQQKITSAQNKLNSDRLKRAKLGPGDKDDKKTRDEWIDAAVRVEEYINKELQRIYSERIQQEEEMIRRRLALTTEQRDAEEKAIEDSTLDAKNKHALEVQLEAQKKADARAAAIEDRKLRIEEFNFNKKLQLANAAVNIAAAIIKDGLTTPKSIADAVIGAAQIAVILATKPPSFAEGTDFFEGGLARYGEDGAEEVRVPGKKPFIAFKETVSYLPRGTEIIPLRDEHPEFQTIKKDDSWEQTRFLAKQIKKSNKEIKNVFSPTIIIDSPFEARRRQILGN